MMFKWKRRTLAIHEAYKLVKELGVKPERACDFILSGHDSDRYCRDVESMKESQFQLFVKEVRGLVENTQ
ncbi:hypothetical protein AV654_17870 [Paenibacillus elgii]|uniref:Uncharacterized protein n=1 Tax=Paenibacillus elgii TaxID=189691 RepID=A0A163YFB2_9BACL|nr:hypothetical protein [Paenibacillus elgii]KZE79337.1 hypothetical protein AV654_17870 [Paenibacillus elgii]